MNDKFTLIAAATGGLMLSVALSGILKGTPVTTWEQARMSSYPVANVRIISNNK
ncbi:hypothetical protein [Anabaena azotica]|uniref:hypothetical protein n=1 Tax=Anabaena azotica TaxID=197653 RepID=UPI0039A650CF